METLKNSYGDIFLDKYRELERLVQKKFNDVGGNAPIFYLSHKAGYEKYSAKLDCCREIRNLISHYPREKGAFPVEPSLEMIDFLDSLIYRMSNRPKCKDVATPFKDMYWRTMDDSVSKTIEAMRDNSYTHVPILDDKRVVGIFNSTSLFQYMADQGNGNLENLSFGDISRYLSLKGRKREIFTFHNQFTFLDELQEVFQKQYRSGKRIGIAFLTHTGNPNERILAMLTAWDVLGKN